MNDMNWDDLRLFVAVANAGGLAGAVAVTGLSAPTLGRRMLALEDSTGRELFIRRAKGYDLTSDGSDLLRQAAGLAGQIDAMTKPRDSRLIKISAGIWTTHMLCRNAQSLMADGTTLRFVASNEMLDIPHREALIGIRNQRPEHVGLAGRRIGPVHFARYGRAGTPWVQAIGSTPSANWVRDNAPNDTIEVTQPTHALDLARAGVAQAVLPRFIGDNQPDLARQSDDIAALCHDQWIVSHNTDRFIPHVRRCIDSIADVLKTYIKP